MMDIEMPAADRLHRRQRRCAGLGFNRTVLQLQGDTLYGEDPDKKVGDGNQVD